MTNGNVEVLKGVIEVFKTNVSSEKEATRIISHLLTKWPEIRINFDLDDCDNILRVEALNGCIEVELIIQFLGNLGYGITELE